ncbi:MAG: hypothetical protein F4180_08460 [Chloroflexi bacterium]|nr:hypothetical protein [Chloroflexota bacterium]
MPYKSANVRRMHARDRYRTKAIERKKAAKKAAESFPRVPDDPVQQVKLIREWSRELKTPAGHPRVGLPMELPDYACAFLERALTVPESGLIIARKNAKSTILAIFCLAYLIGPMKAPNWRGSIVSLSLHKTRELLTLANQIIIANELPLRIKKTPYPGQILNDRSGAILECLSADKHSGHSGGYDLCCVDEGGLMDADKHRELLAGLHSSLSAREGRLIHITIRGDCELIEELIKRSIETPKTTYVKVYDAPEECAIQDADAWAAANPGIQCGIKSEQYMRDRAVQVANSPDDELLFRAHDLNQRVNPGKQVLCSVSEWQRLEVDELPAREGPCYAGVDLADTDSMACFAVYWPATGRLEIKGAFPLVPDLKTRGKRDKCGVAYLTMQTEGSLILTGERVTDASNFLAMCFEDLSGSDLIALGADRYRKQDLPNVLAEVPYTPDVVWRGTGASAVADGSHDVRAFRRAVLSEQIKVLPLAMWRTALRYAVIKYPDGQNPKLDKSLRRGRIDAMQASVIAVGLGALEPAQERRTPGFYMVGGQ